MSLEGFLHSHLRLELYKDETAVMTVRMRQILSIPKRLCAGGALCYISVWLILCKRIIWFLFYSGSLFCVYGILNVFSNFIGAMIFNNVYESTLGIGFNGLVFLLNAGLKTFPLVIIR